MKAYCLGYTHAKCDTCQHEKDWQTLNQMPDAQRLPLQTSMTKIDSDKCRLTGMGEHRPTAHGAGDQEGGAVYTAMLAAAAPTSE